MTNEVNAHMEQFLGPRRYLKRAWTDLPAVLAFRHSVLAKVAYFCLISGNRRASNTIDLDYTGG